MRDDAVIGTCAGCAGDIISGQGVTVDATNGRWHPECRVAAVRQQSSTASSTEPDAPKRRGRPPITKQPVAAE